MRQVIIICVSVAMGGIIGRALDHSGASKPVAVVAKVECFDYDQGPNKFAPDVVKILKQYEPPECR